MHECEACRRAGKRSVTKDHVRHVHDLTPGTQFALSSGRQGELLKVTPSRAQVLLEGSRTVISNYTQVKPLERNGPPREVSFTLPGKAGEAIDLENQYPRMEWEKRRRGRGHQYVIQASREDAKAVLAALERETEDHPSCNRAIERVEDSL